MAFTATPIQFRPPSLPPSTPPTLTPKTLNPQFPKPHKNPFTLSCTYSQPATFPTTPNSEQTNTSYSTPSTNGGSLPPPVLKKRKRYRKEYPGESIGITEEMRFVAMKMRNNKGTAGGRSSRVRGCEVVDEEEEEGGGGGCWEPGLEGFVKYLVDSKLVFDTVEGLVEDSTYVSYAYFRKTGLERSDSLARDLEWFGQQNILISEPSGPGISYASYLKELSARSAPLFLSHFYNIYFSHLAGGQVIAKQVAEKLLVEKELDFYKWDEDAEELLKVVREKLNRLSEHWSRDDKNKCLKEATKSFRYMGQIVRLIIL